MDSKLVPPRTDQFTFSIQRQVGSKATVEIGYIGMISRNEQWRAELNAVPYMTTLNGQTFASAFANIYQAMSSGQAVSAQPFFESAMGGADVALLPRLCELHRCCREQAERRHPQHQCPPVVVGSG